MLELADKEKAINEYIKQKRNTYYKEWRNNNKDKVREYIRTWRNNNKDKVREYNKNYWRKKAVNSK